MLNFNAVTQIIFDINWLMGIGITISLTFFALILGVVLSIIFSILCQSSKKYICKPIEVIIFIIKGTPILVQIFFIYYGIGQFISVKYSILKVFTNAFFCSGIALSLNSAAYMTDIVMNAFEDLPTGQYLSGIALSFKKYQIYRYILIPQVIKRILPAYSNEAIILLKSTSLSASITLMDIMGVGNKIMSQTYIIIPTLFVLSLIYLVLNIFLSKFIAFLASKNAH